MSRLQSAFQRSIWKPGQGMFRYFHCNIIQQNEIIGINEISEEARAGQIMSTDEDEIIAFLNKNVDEGDSSDGNISGIDLDKDIKELLTVFSNVDGNKRLKKLSDKKN